MHSPEPGPKAASRRAFTLVELLIVIAVMAIIAAMVIPQFNNALQEARISATLSGLHGLADSIELYKLHHQSQTPSIVRDGGIPQLTSTTDADGNTGTGAGYEYGPYLLNGMPVNPLNGSAEVVETTVAPPTNLDKRTGWIYHPPSGRIWAGEAGNNGLLPF